MSTLLTIRCMHEPPDKATVPPGAANRELHTTFRGEVESVALSGDRLLTRQAMRLLMRLDGDLRHARADFNQDRFRRIMHARSKAVARLRRRWAKIEPAPSMPLSNLRRRYNANLAGYLYESRQ
jgi:hypothetical protein